MVIHSRRHQNDCPAVHTLTDAARDTILSKAAHKAQEAAAAENKQPEDDETKRKAAEKQALDAAEAAQAAENKEREEDETKCKNAETRKRNAARAGAKKQYIKATADVKKTQAALAKTQVTCTKNSKAVVLGQQHIKASERAKTKADKVHTASVLQLALLLKGVADTKRIVTAAVKRKAAGT
jgi:hypothetical protein